MAIPAERPIAFLYEHPDWFRPLFATLERRGIPYVKLHAPTHHFAPNEAAPPWSLVVNRMSPSAWLRGHGSSIFYTLQYLEHLERHGVPVVNGSEAFRLEISKARQYALLERLRLPYPASRVIHDVRQAPAAAQGLRYPIAVKPNIGGSGAGVRRFETPEELEAAVLDPIWNLGIDSTGIVQEFIPVEGGYITRVEVLEGRLLYAIRVHSSGRFDLCPADICRDTPFGEACPAEAPKAGVRVEGYVPSRAIVQDVQRILEAGGLDVGGVEYFTDSRDGRRYYYDINALSNFVADAPNVVGFDPFETFVDSLERRASAAVLARAAW
jgi:hypothetical protein